MTAEARLKVPFRDPATHDGGDVDERYAADRKAARDVLKVEAEALSLLADTVDASFSRVLDRLESLRGRVIVTGIGKSGHVARKISATLASTGTPSFYIHPSEASHGDLGMLAPDDAVIALSNSGGTPELADIIAFTRRFRIPLIAMTGGASSPLAEQADEVLLLPRARAPEACPYGLAPTTSTTLMMALGDAIAIAMMRRRGFTSEDFRVFHPGGALGSRLRKVGDLMHAGDSVPLAPAHQLLSETLVVMTAKSFGCVGVVDEDGQLIGIVTDGDLRRHMAPDLLSRETRAIMTPHPQTIRASALAEEAVAQMNGAKHPFTSLFVVDERSHPVGILHMHDCLRAGVL